MSVRKPSNDSKRPKRRTHREQDSFEEHLAKLLRQAEIAGVLRWVLQGASKAFRKIESQNLAWDSTKRKMLLRRREIVVRHVLSLLIELDSWTKFEIAQDLIGDLYCRGSKEVCARDQEAGLIVEPDARAGRGLFSLLRLVVAACCEFLKNGDEEFASEAVLHAANLVEAVNKLARCKPKLFESIASERIDWPILAWQHYPKKSDFQELARQIQLASKSPVQPRRHHTWKPHAEINRYLLEMLVVQCWGDGRPLTGETIPYYLDKVLMPLFEKVATEEGGWENYPEFALIARSAGKRGKKGVQRSEIRNRIKRALSAMTR